MAEFVQPFTRELQPQEEGYWNVGWFWISGLHCYAFRHSTRFICKSSPAFSESEWCACLDSCRDLWVFLKWCPWTAKNMREKGEEGRGKTRSNWACFRQWPGVVSLPSALLAASSLLFYSPAWREPFWGSKPQTSPQHGVFRAAIPVCGGSRGEGSRAGCWLPGEIRYCTQPLSILTNKYGY